MINISAAKSRRKRPRRAGERYPSGGLKPASNGMTLALWHRIPADGIRLGADARLGTQLGRLGMLRELTDAQLTAGLRMAEIYRDFERRHGRRRSIKSPSFEVSRGGQVADLQIDEKRLVAVERAFLRLGDQLSFYPVKVRDALERLCVDDLAVPLWQIEVIRIALDRLAGHFGIDCRPRDGRRRR